MAETKPVTMAVSDNAGCLVRILAVFLCWAACQAEKFIDMSIAERSAAIGIRYDGGAP